MTELICNFIDFVLELLSLLLPDVTFATELFSNIGEYIEFGLDLLIKVNFMIPVPLVMGILWAMFGLRILFITLYVLNWVIRRIFDVIP